MKRDGEKRWPITIDQVCKGVNPNTDGHDFYR